ncbi:MAG: HNH endonuclease domain-containing protein [Bacteroidota bacterium]|nr:HNH endonuclease domain-containing protein [Bacteroidota bacterium]
MNLPQSSNINANILASCFKNTVATYKFYWLLAIVESVEEGKVKIPKIELFSKMISSAWYTVNYFKISFGVQDELHNKTILIKELENLTIDIDKIKLLKKIGNPSNKQTTKELDHFDKNVPHWFLSPWFNQSSKNEIYIRSQKFENNCLYALFREEIIINPHWIVYLTENAKIIKDFCFWNLSLFLQSKNPNVPDIPNKLIKPIIRNSLTKQTNDFWKIVFEKERFINCIFTEKPLRFEDKNFALDHYVPHAFVSHDLIWNLAPIDKGFNNRKSDRLPFKEIHFERFFQLQEKAFQINKTFKPNSKYMEEYLTIFSNLDNFNKERFKEVILPLITIASNNGFSYLKDE